MLPGLVEALCVLLKSLIVEIIRWEWKKRRRWALLLMLGILGGCESLDGAAGMILGVLTMRHCRHVSIQCC
jgi:hypothetical protein